MTSVLYVLQRWLSFEVAKAMEDTFPNVTDLRTLYDPLLPWNAIDRIPGSE
jgi:hypothetical protein